ncbi:putative uncharacterized protein [Burkholderiales bacterium GJ-E10]|nr:putative uncharacterized protein [Burkholderiales bacterium GJ-E10]
MQHDPPNANKPLRDCSPVEIWAYASAMLRGRGVARLLASEVILESDLDGRGGRWGTSPLADALLMARHRLARREDSHDRKARGAGWKKSWAATNEYWSDRLDTVSEFDIKEEWQEVQFGDGERFGADPCDLVIAREAAAGAEKKELTHKQVRDKISEIRRAPPGEFTAERWPMLGEGTSKRACARRKAEILRVLREELLMCDPVPNGGKKRPKPTSHKWKQAGLFDGEGGEA